MKYFNESKKATTKNGKNGMFLKIFYMVKRKGN